MKKICIGLGLAFASFLASAQTTNLPGVPIFGAPPALALTANYYGTNVPTGNLTAGVGSLYLQNSNGVYYQWIKTNSTGNTGWTAFGQNGGSFDPLGAATSMANSSSNLLMANLGAPLVITNGSSDATVQSAFNRGGTIYFQPGDYSLSTNLFFKTNTYLVGNGAWLHWTNAAALLASNAFLDTGTNFNGNSITIDNLGWDGGIYPASGWNVASYYDAVHLFPNGFFW